jgi:hypothetical protein
LHHLSKRIAQLKRGGQQLADLHKNGQFMVSPGFDRLNSRRYVWQHDDNLRNASFLFNRQPGFPAAGRTVPIENG